MNALDDALRGIIRDEVRSALAELRAPAPPAADRQLSGPELDRAMAWSARTRRRLEAGGLPGIGAGRLRRYDLAGVQRWLDARRPAGEARDFSDRADALLARGRRAGGSR